MVPETLNAEKSRQPIYQDIRRHGEKHYPTTSAVASLWAHSTATSVQSSRHFAVITQAADSTRTHYHIDPREVIRAQRDARERGLDIVGFYHSHPDHSAQWSPTDLAEAHWIGCSYLIVAVENGEAMETRSFVLAGTLEEDKRLVDEELLVTDEERDPEIRSS